MAVLEVAMDGGWGVIVVVAVVLLVCRLLLRLAMLGAEMGVVRWPAPVPIERA